MEVGDSLESLLDFSLINVELTWELWSNSELNAYKDNPLDAPMNDNFNKLDQEILVEPFISSYRVDQQATVYPSTDNVRSSHL